jgi:hypothetical protein
MTLMLRSQTVSLSCHESSVYSFLSVPQMGLGTLYYSIRAAYASKRCFQALLSNFVLTTALYVQLESHHTYQPNNMYMGGEYHSGSRYDLQLGICLPL